MSYTESPILESRSVYSLKTDALTVHYDKTQVLWDISFAVPTGVLVGVLGPNGAGKSTLLKAALNLIKPFSGTADFFGRKIAYVPQRETVDWDFPITAFELVLMGRYGRLGLFGRIKKADIAAADRALEQVGMSSFSHRQISELSGGQQQRLFIARALVQDADILLLDEPFTGVDLSTEKAMIDLLKKQKENKKTVFVVHHDLTTVEEYFDWGIFLNTRLIAAGPIKEVFNAEILARTFGKNQALFDEAALLSAKSITGLL